MDSRKAISAVTAPRWFTNLDTVFRDTPIALAKVVVERFNG
jgi:hypothetical protein